MVRFKSKSDKHSPSSSRSAILNENNILLTNITLISCSKRINLHNDRMIQGIPGLHDNRIDIGPEKTFMINDENVFLFLPFFKLILYKRDIGNTEFTVSQSFMRKIAIVDSKNTFILHLIFSIMNSQSFFEDVCYRHTYEKATECSFMSKINISNCY